MNVIKMKATLLLLSLCLITVFDSQAQDTEPTDTTDVEVIIEGHEHPHKDGEHDQDNDHDIGDSDEFSVEISIGGTRDTTKNLLTRWFTLGLGVNPVSVDGEFDLPSGGIYDDFDLRLGNSTNVDLGLVQNKLNLISHRLYLKTGIGLDINKYSFDENFRIDPDTDMWVTSQVNGDTKKNRLTATYIHVPLMLNFESSDQHYDSFRLNVGGFAGLRLGSNQKIKFTNKDENPFEDKQIYKEKDNFNFNTINYGLKTELGYGPVNLYAKYHFNDLIEDEQQLNNVSLGLMIVPF